MGDIKSALEIAQEKVEKLEGATEEERLRWQYVPEGERLAARYFKEACNLLAELSNYEERARRFVAEGAAEILTRNISLPKDELTRKKNKRAMDGLKILKHDKASVENIYSGMRRIFDHYQSQGEQQRRQAYEALKGEFEAKIKRAMQQQLGPLMGMKVDVTVQPQFREEWHRVLAQLDSQYLRLLEENKRELLAIF